MMGFGMGFGFIWMILFWGGLILLAVWLVSTLFPGSNANTRNKEETPSARELLDRRYARGEISREQYEEMRDTLAS